MAYNLSQKVRNEVLAREGARVVHVEDCVTTFADEGIDAIGLNRDQVHYLRILSCDTARGIGGIAGTLDRDVVVVEESIEPVLLSLGLAERTRAGRKLTHVGQEHLRRTGQL